MKLGKGGGGKRVKQAGDIQVSSFARWQPGVLMVPSSRRREYKRVMFSKIRLLS